VEKAAAKALSAGNKADAIDILAAFSAKHADDYHSAYDELMTHLVGLSMHNMISIFVFTSVIHP